MDEAKMEKCTGEILEREKANPGYLENLIKAFKRKERLYHDYVAGLESLAFSSLAIEELIGHYWTFIELYHNQFCLPVLPLIYKEHLSDRLYKRIQPRFGDRTAGVLSCITTSDRETFSYQQRKSMLEIAARVFDAGHGNVFSNNTPCEILDFLKSDMPEIHEELVRHSSKYFWINNNYRRAVVLKPLDFIEKIKDEAVSFDHPGEELRIMDETSRNALENKKRYLEELDEEEKVISRLLAEGSWWQDQRKKNNLIAGHVLMQFLEEASSRTGIEANILLNATVYELPLVLNNKIGKEILEKRYDEGFSLYTDHSPEGYFVKSAPGKRYRLDKVEKVEEIRGTPASRGSAEGEAVVITREEEFNKMKDGAILVAVMTRPEYTPLMKRAAGIITDEGGLTCHAAVVSREFRIPCIVGTRIATSVLRDGDRVRLDADKGKAEVSG
ncbi:hypothetical protein GF318_05045 [Candidatus Micrarchaeota archaeon]|nr:hypothetical protein [Candidatus Micrarchaeota archaeon]